MDIGLFDIGNSATHFAETILLGGTLTEAMIQKNTVAFSMENRTYVVSLIMGAVSAYHDSLRRCLLEKGIDIGDFEGSESSE